MKHSVVLDWEYRCPECGSIMRKYIEGPQVIPITITCEYSRCKRRNQKFRVLRMKVEVEPVDPEMGLVADATVQ